MNKVLSKTNSSKRAQAARTLLSAVIVIVIMFAIFSFFNTAESAAESSSKKTKCLASVNLHANNPSSSFDDTVNCPVQDLLIEEPINEKDAGKVHNQMARAMYDCWKNFGEGQKTLFHNRFSGRFCKPCTLIDFDDKGKTIEGFDEFLKTTKTPDGKTTYAEFFTGTSTKNINAIFKAANINPENLKTVKKEPLSSDNTYLVVFEYVKGREAINEFMTVIVNDPYLLSLTLAPTTTLQPVVGPLFVSYYIILNQGEPEVAQFIFLREYKKEQLQQLGCTELPGRTWK